MRSLFVALALLTLFPLVGKSEEPAPYVVERGDTLWDLSEEFLSGPFRWKEIRRLNPQIKNPDLIYPGDRLLIPESEGEASLRSMEVPAAVAEGSQQSAPLVPTAPAPALDPDLVRRAGFVAPSLEAAGKIVGSLDGRNLLSLRDPVFLKGDLRADREYQVVRKVRRIRHPENKKVLGYLVAILGAVRVEQEAPPRGVVTAAYDAITSGDLLLELKSEGTEGEQSGPRGEGEAREGVVVESLFLKTNSATFDIVFVDRGRENGLVAGDRLMIKKKAANLVSSRKKLPFLDEPIAEGMVLLTTERTASVLIQKADFPVSPGDPFSRSR